ncbi:MAG: peptidylprolyl isomerase [Anaerolineae bacterium]
MMLKVRQLTSVLALTGTVFAAAACGGNANPAASGQAQITPVITSQKASTCVQVTDPEVQMPVDANKQQFSAPEQVVDPTHSYCAIFQVEHGRFVIQLYPQNAPKNVNNFVFLASRGFYDGVPFHRVIPGFMAQTGDPTGTGAGGPGYDNIPLEASGPLKYDKPGVVGVARTSVPDSAGSQFFITFDPAPFLDNQYTIIGQVVLGMEVVNQIKIRNTDNDPNAASITPEKLLSVRIVDIGAQ